MGLKGYRLWVMGQLDSTCRAPPEALAALHHPPLHEALPRRPQHPLRPAELQQLEIQKLQLQLRVRVRVRVRVHPPGQPPRAASRTAPRCSAAGCI
jgi:hypothetical protein